MSLCSRPHGSTCLCRSSSSSFPIQALGFSLHTTPSQVDFHYRRLMKVLEWSLLGYLGPLMHKQWMDSLDDEDLRHAEHEAQRKRRRERKERKLSKLQCELRLQPESNTKRRDKDVDSSDEKLSEDGDQIALDGSATIDVPSPFKAHVVDRKAGGARGLLHRFSLKRHSSTDKLSEAVPAADRLPSSEHALRARHKSMVRSPSLPVIANRRQTKAAHVALDVNEVEESNGNSGARLWSYYRSHVPHNCETAVSSSTREIRTTISHSLLRHLFEMSLLRCSHMAARRQWNSL